MDLHRIAEEIENCQLEGREMEKITLRHPALTVADAYQIQALCTERALARGDRLVGWKMGLTSVAKQRSVGVEEPIFGRLPASLELHEPVVHGHRLIHPRVEPEIAFVFKQHLGGANVTPRDVWLATECVLPALEVIDSRYQNFSFTLVDVIADNASAAGFIVGDQGYSPYHTAWDEVGVALFKNGEVMQSGTGAAVLGHPVKSVVELAHMLARDGLSIEPGMVVLTGGITEAIHVAAGDVVEARFDGLGSLTLRIEG